jgi:hypothetical protein
MLTLAYTFVKEKKQHKHQYIETRAYYVGATTKYSNFKTFEDSQR